MVKVDKLTSCNCHWYRKKTAFFPTPTSLLKPVSLHNTGSTLSRLIVGPESCLHNEGERRCCSVWALLWEILPVRTGLLTAGCWHPFPHEREHSDLCLARVCFWGLRKRLLAGRLYPGLLQASTHELFVFVQGQEIPWVSYSLLCPRAQERAGLAV